MGIAAIALIIGFGILLAREYEEGVLLTLFCAVMNYIAIPLIILFLENIIPLLILIVVGIIIIIGLVIGLHRDEYLGSTLLYNDTLVLHYFLIEI